MGREDGGVVCRKIITQQRDTHLKIASSDIYWKLHWACSRSDGSISTAQTTPTKMTHVFSTYRSTACLQLVQLMLSSQLTSVSQLCTKPFLNMTEPSRETKDWVKQLFWKTAVISVIVLYLLITVRNLMTGPCGKTHLIWTFFREQARVYHTDLSCSCITWSYSDTWSTITEFI